jgi:hypothetical protein
LESPPQKILPEALPSKSQAARPITSAVNRQWKSEDAKPAVAAVGFCFVQMKQLSTDHDILPHQRLKMKRKTPLGTSYYEIVKYNLRTRKDLQVVPGRIQGLSEVNQKIDTLNALLKSSKEDEGGDIVYYRRKVQS